MKKIILILALLVYTATAAENTYIKFYMNDGITKEYNIRDIENIEIGAGSENGIMKIYYNQLEIVYYSTASVDKIILPKDNSVTEIMNVFVYGESRSFEISAIDSIIFQMQISIGTQVWLAHNLDVTTYNNGDLIPQVSDPDEWVNLTTGAWCFFQNDPANGADYGKLYNWYAVNDPRGLAPEGWHVPTDEEWKTLEMSLGMSKVEADAPDVRGTDEGSQMSGRADLWYDGKLETNPKFGTSGFLAAPGGYCDGKGAFSSLQHSGYWWSTSEFDSTSAWFRGLYYDRANIYRSHNRKSLGFSVRLVRD